MGSFVGGDAIGTGGVLTITPTWPATDADDIAILLWTGSANAVHTDPPGFTILDAYDPNSGTQRNVLAYRVCDGAESGTFDLTVSIANRHSAVLMVFRGYDPAAPIDGWSRFDETVSQLTHDCPALTTVAADVGIVVLYAERSGTGSTSVTPPTSFASNEFETGSQSAGSGGTMTAAATDSLAVSRSGGTNVDPGNWTGTNTATANAITYTLALAPASTGTNAAAGSASGTGAAFDASVSAVGVVAYAMLRPAVVAP